MNRKEAAELLPIIKAFSEGKVIEGIYKGIESPWFKVEDMVFDGGTIYRIKPEPKYRQFKDAEECWQEMQKHQPFGWIKSKDDSTISKFMFIDSLSDEIATIRADVRFTYSELVQYYIFADGTPFGILEEE